MGRGSSRTSPGFPLETCGNDGLREGSQLLRSNLQGIQPTQIKLIQNPQPTDKAHKKRASFAGRRPVRDAIASPLNICFAIVPASQQRRFSFDSISLCRRDSESALGKSFLLSTRLSELAPSGAWVEGLIQAARCRTRCLTELLAPAFWRAMFARWTVLSYHELPPNLGRASTGAHRCHSSGP
jgi:hypothetical protein